jgi:hypothetical protein
MTGVAFLPPLQTANVWGVPFINAILRYHNGIPHHVMDEKLCLYADHLDHLILDDGVTVSCGRIGVVSPDVTSITGGARRRIRTNHTKRMIERKP